MQAVRLSKLASETRQFWQAQADILRRIRIHLNLDRHILGIVCSGFTHGNLMRDGLAIARQRRRISEGGVHLCQNWIELR